MKNLLAWIKLNPITVTSLVVVLLALSFIGWISFFQAPALQEAMEEEAQVVNTLDRYSSQTIEVPPENADADVRTLSNVVINEATVEVLGGIYDSLLGEAQRVEEMAVRINRQEHETLVEGLFPDVPSALTLRARAYYRMALPAMLGNQEAVASLLERTEGQLQLPYLDSGMPLDPEQVQLSLDQRLAEYLWGRDREQVTDEDVSEFRQEQQTELMNQLIAHAQDFHIYAVSDMGNPTQPNPQFPLQVARLGTTTGSPTPQELWEGQLQLWIMEDIIRAIAQANGVADSANPDNAGEGNGEAPPSSVLNAPIKRLLRLEVLPGYVGYHTLGAVRMEDAGGPTHGQLGAAELMAPAGAAPPDNRRQVELSENFYIGPTGRVSNGIFDVRHARLVIHADMAKLPEFFNALSHVNFMTIIKATYTDIDEFGPEGLGSLYLYGPGNIVEAEFIIETLWLRQWTAALMPEVVQDYLGMTGAGATAEAP